MPIGITSIGIGVPAHKHQQKDIADRMAIALDLSTQDGRRLKSIYSATCIDTRHSVLEDFDMLIQGSSMSTKARMQIYKNKALSLALQAIRHCLDALPNFEVNTITHIITVSCTGMYAPGIDVEIIQRLNLSGSVKRTAINFMGCYGVFNGFKLALDFCKANDKAKVLLVSVELCSIHLQKWHSLDNLISGAIFADGAGAVLIENTLTTDKLLTFKGAYCDLLPQGSEAMAWDITDHGFDIVLSSYVAKLIESGIAEFMDKLLHQHCLDFKNIDYYAIHPGSPKILQACEQALKITEKDNYFSYEVLRHFGNMSSTTIIFVLHLLWQTLDKNAHDKNIFCCAFGPGLTLESILLSVQHA